MLLLLTALTARLFRDFHLPPIGLVLFQAITPIYPQFQQFSCYLKIRRA